MKKDNSKPTSRGLLSNLLFKKIYKKKILNHLNKWACYLNPLPTYKDY